MKGSQRRIAPAVGYGSVGLLAVAVLAISSSAVMVRWAEASAVALAFWRTVGGSIVLAPFAARSASGSAVRHPWFVLGAGVALAVHFASWLASLEMTSIAASVTLVSTAPLFVALLQWAFGGTRPPRRTWLAIAITIVGVGIITGGDRSIGSTGTSGEELAGNLLALLGAVSMAVYLVLGQRARAELGATDYAARTYAVAAVTLLPVALVTQASLLGFDSQTWLVILAMILGPQLAGHTVLNALLRRLGSLTVSLALLAEPVGASLLAWLFLDEAPPAVAWIGGPIVLAGLATHLLSASALTLPQAVPGEFIVDHGGAGEQ